MSSTADNKILQLNQVICIVSDAGNPTNLEWILLSIAPPDLWTSDDLKKYNKITGKSVLTDTLLSMRRH